MDDVTKSLELGRLELLDMGLRGNTLLHFRHGAKTLEVFDELSAQVFDLLVQQKKPMSFLPVPEEIEKAEQDEEIETPPLPELLEEKYGDSRHSDNKLQTKLVADALDKKLLKISTEANTYYQEQGVDILYLALGFLTWYEDRNSDKPRKAPLVLVPVSLDRSTAKDRFKVGYTEADLGSNLSLEAKMKMEFNLILPEFQEDFELQSYFDAVSQAIEKQPRWTVNENEIALGFFSFGKFQMYQDLDASNWPEDKKPGKHSVLKGLMGGGFENRGGELNDAPTGSIDPVLQDLTELHFVKDSDSSQSAAVMAVKGGDNLVIQGPPGTGKSQTITNIIAESIAENKTVLFVAEKMAALEVVKRRLDECHLGDGVLELHSHKSNKRAVLEELERTLSLGTPKSPDRGLHKARHQQLRTQLDDYSQAVNTKILNSGLSYVDALGLHLRLKNSVEGYSLPGLDFSTMKDWSENEFVQACANVSQLVDHLDVMGVPARNPYSASKLKEFSPVDQNKLVSALGVAISKASDCQSIGGRLAEEMMLKEPETIQEVEAICRAASRAIESPHLSGLKLTTDDWQQRRDQLKALLDAGESVHSVKAARADDLIDHAWRADVLTARQVYATTGKKWWRFISGDYRRAKQQLQGLMKAELPKEADACLQLIDDILNVQTASEQYQRHERLGEQLFGAQWQGLESDWVVLRALSDWVVDLYDEVGSGKIPEGLLRFLEGDKSLADWSDNLETLGKASELLRLSLKALSEKLSVESLSEIDSQAITLSELHTQLSTWLDRVDDLYHMTRYNRIREMLCSNNLRAMDEIAYSWEYPPALLLSALKLTWYEGLVNHAYGQSNAIKQFDRISHEGAIKEFRQLDEELFHHAQEALVSKLHGRIPHGGSAGEMGVIRKEMNKKRRHMPLRKLVRQAGRAIQQIKPVFMMSPMSVATYLEQGALDFDLVVFDEASQVKVVDALGAILRGKQVVVVGDTKQMPPTDFFGKAVELDDDEAEESHTADIESILSMFLSQGAPESMLRWHYRSRHDSLITVSNQEFYDNKLMIFPSPGVNPKAKGLSFNYNPEAIYERGTSRTNPLEARGVAEAVMRHARTTPELTLGVVAFSTAQRDCILLELERLRRLDDSCESFFASGALEGFFVKNLENVQGDERDVIYISIGYGRTATGNVSKSFGPVNREGGHRRLNVLITRARLAMEVFSNFTADELATKGSSPFGVKALKAFLKYAETGQLEDRHETGKDTDSPFEDEVINAIQGLGYEVEPQVGSAGFFIDIAVRDPDKPGRYVLAVECDGASYHSSASARDRDRLRQNVLEGLGWRFHRIWSTDWFRNPHKETERVKEAIEDAFRYYQQLDSQSVVDDENKTNQAGATASINRGEVPVDKPASSHYTLAEGTLGINTGAEIHELNLGVVSRAIARVVNIEGAIHIKEVARRITESAGYSRVGARIMSHVERASQVGHSDESFHVSGDFIYEDRSQNVTVRNRANLPAAMKKIELVPPEEITQAILDSVEMSFSLQEDELVSEVLGLLGFQRATGKAKAPVQQSIESLINAGSLVVRGGLVSAS